MDNSLEAIGPLYLPYHLSLYLNSKRLHTEIQDDHDWSTLAEWVKTETVGVLQFQAININ